MPITSSASRCKKLGGYMLCYLDGIDEWMKISERDSKIIKALWANPDLTHAECGERFGLSHAAIHRIEKKILCKMTHHLGAMMELARTGKVRSGFWVGFG